MVNTTKLDKSQWNNGLVGLKNLGNTCYLNSSLQALLHIEPLMQYFLSNQYKSDINTISQDGYQGEFATSFGNLAHELWKTRDKSINPQDFHTVLNKHANNIFPINVQHDAQELLSFLIDGLSEDLNLVKEKIFIEQPDSDINIPEEKTANICWENQLKCVCSIVQSLFMGQFKSLIYCKNKGCNYSSARYEPFNILSVPIPAKNSTGIEMKDCFDKFMEEEKMDATVVCQNCKENNNNNNVWRRLTIWRHPPILILQLKRFQFNNVNRISTKINNRVNFPFEDFDISQYMSNRKNVKNLNQHDIDNNSMDENILEISECNMYDLYSIIHHHGEGESAYSGHYTATIRNSSNKKWYVNFVML